MLVELCTTKQYMWVSHERMFLFYILLDEKVKKFCDPKMTVNY